MIIEDFKMTENYMNRVNYRQKDAREHKNISNIFRGLQVQTVQATG
jgi:hypothetical protein